MIKFIIFFIEINDSIFLFGELFKYTMSFFLLSYISDGLRLILLFIEIVIIYSI